MLNDFLKPAGSVDLSDENQALIAAQVINTLNTSMLTPPERYARVRFLGKVMEYCCAELGAAAEAYCEKEDLGSDGKQFEHHGLRFLRQFDIDYNYAGNDDVEGFEGAFAAANIKVKLAEGKKKSAKIDYDAAKSELNVAKQRIEQAHPNMKPLIQKVVFKFIPWERSER